MTLDEAIQHAREVGNKLVCNKEDKYCGQKYLLLADWLEELKAFRNAYKTPPKQSKVCDMDDVKNNNTYSKCRYDVTLRNGLSPEADVIKVLQKGFNDLDSAKQFALSYISDSANKSVLGCKSYYNITTFWKDNSIIGIDYGSHSKFIIIAPAD